MLFGLNINTALLLMGTFFGLNIKVILFLWVVLALINAGLAQSKNKDGLTWFVISIVFGPAATLAIVISKKKYDD